MWAVEKQRAHEEIVLAMLPKTDSAESLKNLLLGSWNWVGKGNPCRNGPRVPDSVLERFQTEIEYGIGAVRTSPRLDKYLLINDLVESQFRADIGAGRA